MSFKSCKDPKAIL